MTSSSALLSGRVNTRWIGPRYSAAMTCPGWTRPRLRRSFCSALTACVSCPPILLRVFPCLTLFCFFPVRLKARSKQLDAAGEHDLTAIFAMGGKLCAHYWRGRACSGFWSSPLPSLSISAVFTCPHPNLMGGHWPCFLHHRRSPGCFGTPSGLGLLARHGEFAISLRTPRRAHHVGHREG